jgi:hypothetical protein
MLNPIWCIFFPSTNLLFSSWRFSGFGFWDSDPFWLEVKPEINQNAKENQSNQSKSKSEIY